MASETITGVVEDIRLEAGFRSPHGHSVEVAQVVRATLRLDDGTAAYVQTSIGHMTYYEAGVIGPCGAEHYHSSATDGAARDAADGRWPWALESGVVIALPTPGSPFEGSAAYPYSRPVLAVWAGDRVTVRGSSEQRTSKHDVAYRIIKRAQVLALERPADAQARAA